MPPNLTEALARLSAGLTNRLFTTGCPIGSLDAERLGIELSL
jgi:hypothetical protein